MNDVLTIVTDSSSEQPASPPVGSLSFAVLGKSSFEHDDHDITVQTSVDAHWTARKVCAHLKVTSALMTAIVVHPGGASSDLDIAAATKQLIERANELTLAAERLITVPSDEKQYAAYKNLLRQQSVDVVTAQWRMANATGKKVLTINQMTDMFKMIVDADLLENDGEVPSYPIDIDAITARRMSLLAITPEIHQAVNSFDYFHPQPEELVKRGVAEVLDISQAGMAKLVGAQASQQTFAMVSQSLIGKIGSLYAANYLSIARKDIGALQVMPVEERARKLYIYRAVGLPMQHVDASFRRLAHRMIAMVCEAVPEVAATCRYVRIDSLPDDVQSMLMQSAQEARPDLLPDVIHNARIEIASRDVAPFYRQVIAWTERAFEHRGDAHIIDLQGAYQRDPHAVPPIIIDTEKVCSGRSRLIAAQRIGLEKIAVIDLGQWLASMPLPDKISNVVIGENHEPN